MKKTFRPLVSVVAAALVLTSPGIGCYTALAQAVDEGGRAVALIVGVARMAGIGNPAGGISSLNAFGGLPGSIMLPATRVQTLADDAGVHAAAKPPIEKMPPDANRPVAPQTFTDPAYPPVKILPTTDSRSPLRQRIESDSPPPNSTRSGVAAKFQATDKQLANLTWLGEEPPRVNNLNIDASKEDAAYDGKVGMRGIKLPGGDPVVALNEARYYIPKTRTAWGKYAFEAYWSVFRQIERYQRKHPGEMPRGLRVPAQANETLQWMVDELQKKQDLYTKRGWIHNARAMVQLKKEVESAIHPEGPLYRKMLLLGHQFSLAMSIKGSLSQRVLKHYIYSDKFLSPGIHSYLRKDPRKSLYLIVHHPQNNHLGYTPFNEIAGLPVAFVQLVSEDFLIDGVKISPIRNVAHELSHAREDVDSETLRLEYWGTTSLRKMVNKRIQIVEIENRKIENYERKHPRKMARVMFFDTTHEKYQAVSTKLLSRDFNPIHLPAYLYEGPIVDDHFIHRVRNPNDIGHGLEKVDKRVISEAFHIVRRGLREAFEEVVWKPLLRNKSALRTFLRYKTKMMKENLNKSKNPEYTELDI